MHEHGFLCDLSCISVNLHATEILSLSELREVVERHVVLILGVVVVVRADIRVLVIVEIEPGRVIAHLNASALPTRGHAFRWSKLALPL